MEYTQARWAVEILWTRAHSHDIATRIATRALLKHTIRLAHHTRYHHA